MVVTKIFSCIFIKLICLLGEPHPNYRLKFLHKGAACRRNLTVFIDTKNAKNTRFHFPKRNFELDPWQVKTNTKTPNMSQTRSKSCDNTQIKTKKMQDNQKLSVVFTIRPLNCPRLSFKNASMTLMTLFDICKPKLNLKHFP